MRQMRWRMSLGKRGNLGKVVRVAILLFFPVLLLPEEELVMGRPG